MLKISAVILCLICLNCIDALPHCEVATLPERLIQRNRINVIYTMKSTCKFCHDIVRMPKLKSILRKVNAHLIVAVSNDSERLPSLVPHTTVNIKEVWEALGEENNHFYIIDRCGRLVYEIINPWSDLQIPFLRGAVLATQYNHPCGLCPQDYEDQVKEEKLINYPSINEENQPHPTEEVPLVVHMRLRHTHLGDPNVYDHIILGDQGIHQHLPTDLGKPISTNKNTDNYEKYKETYESTTVLNQEINEIDVSNEHSRSEETNVNNSIKKLSSHSLQKANKTQLNFTFNQIENSETASTSEVGSPRPSDTLETTDESITTTEEERAYYDYMESTESNIEENQTPEIDEHYKERTFLEPHYEKILDWMDYSNEYDDDIG